MKRITKEEVYIHGILINEAGGSVVSIIVLDISDV
jgi:hypothetical protein